VTCASCGAANRDGARFCDSCGAPLTVEAPREQRKVVTVLFCDVSGSTALGERLDPEALRATMARYFEVARVAIERHGGTVEKFIGDAVMAVFGVPTVREDDALRAVRAAQELRDGVDVPVRIGVNTGEVVTGTGESLVTGDAVNVAARLEQAAATGEVLLGAATYALVRDAVDAELLPPLQAKGKAEPLTAYRLLAVTGDTAVARRLDAPFVGRGRERALLEGAWERCVSERACALFTILGTAGVGKSRLAAELLDGLDATVVRGRCLSYGDGITYWPVVEVVKQLLGESPAPSSAIAALLGDGVAPVDEVALAVRKLLETSAAGRPLVVVFDDIQWGEPAFLDLVEHVADWSREAPILLLCLARPDLLDVRPGWGGGKLNATTVLLEPLSVEETDELIDALLAGADLEPELRGRVRTASDGNPLFVEQMLAMIDESPGEVTVPASIQALLAARLDQLPPPERAALERGAVEGQVFHRSAVAALDGDPASLLPLVRKELVRPSAAMLPGDEAFRFRHLLIRDAAYDALPKTARAELHRRFAAWLEARAPDLVELDEIVGYHLEQAAGYHDELGSPIEELRLLAGARLGAAGLRAERRRDTPAAASLLERALALTTEPGDRAELVLALGRALYELGRLDDARAAFAEAMRLGSPDISAEAYFVDAYMRGHSSATSLQELEDELRGRVAEAEAAGLGARALAQAHVTLGQALYWNGRLAEAISVGRLALGAARRANATELEARALATIGASLLWGATPWAEFEAEARSTLAESDRIGFDARAAIGGLAMAAAAQGRPDEARALHAQLDSELRERGHALAAASYKHGWGVSENMAGNYVEGERILREAWDELGRLGERGFRSTIGADLAEALVSLGRVDEALAILDEAEAIGSADDWVTTAQVRASRALAVSALGDHDRAVDLARRAIAVADATEYVWARSYYWLVLGRVLAAAGRGEEAWPALEESIRLGAVKGRVVFADRANELLESIRART
jgi:class 3 adenylate cyclase/tetratricopeptide (TPR) repeat protein